MMPPRRGARDGAKRARQREYARSRRCVARAGAVTSESSIGEAQRGAITFALILATVLSTIASTIANVVLPQIRASTGAAQDEITWVLTSFILAGAVVTPALGWLEQKFGRRFLLLTSIVGFTIGRDALWTGDGHRRAGAFPLAPRRVRRCLHSDVAGDFARHQSAAPARPSDGAMGDRRGAGPHYWTGAGRLAGGEPDLALGVLHQRAAGDRGVLHGRRLTAKA